MGETLEMTLRVQIGVGGYLMFNPRRSGEGQNLPLHDIRDNFKTAKILTPNLL